ncbi:MAG: hypothetical protein HZC38_19630 [Chloroflexi bacterium]|nr:hypothetical protein [Chloroflexota bacterium]
MQTVETIIKGIVITMNVEGAICNDGAIAINGDSIVAVGAANEIAKGYAASQTFDFGGRAIIPRDDQERHYLFRRHVLF